MSKKKKSIKKEHLIIGGAGALALIYLLSQSKEGEVMSFGGGGLGDTPGIDTITTETITIPAGSDDIGGAILLPPPVPGKFFDVPDWVKPAQPKYKPAPGFTGYSSYVGSKKDQVIYGGYKPTGETFVFGGKAFEAQAAKEVVSGGYSPTLAASFGISPEIAAGDGTKKAVSKKETVISKPTSYYEQIPGSGLFVGAKRLKAFLGDAFF